MGYLGKFQKGIYGVMGTPKGIIYVIGIQWE